MSVFGDNLKRRREELLLTQEKLAYMCSGLKGTKIDKNVISYWENGKYLPRTRQLLILSEVLDVTVDFLLKGNLEA